MQSKRRIILYAATGLLVGALVAPLNVNAFQLQNATPWEHPYVSAKAKKTDKAEKGKVHNLCRVQDKVPVPCGQGGY